MSGQTDITIQQARRKATGTLRDAGIDTAALDARVLMGYILDVSRTELLLRDPDPISPGDLKRYSALVDQRSTGVPIAYLVGHREFMGLQFATAPGVLVPRPDTEPLVEWGLGWLESHTEATVVDIGTGSGAIAIATAAYAPSTWNGRMIATDVSEEALTIARSNADALLPSAKHARLEFALGSLAGPLSGPIDLVLTNLPYLTPEQIAGNPDLRHEPSLALDGGEDGLDFVRLVIDDLPRILAPNGAAGFEIDPAQSAEVQNLLRTALPHHHVHVVHDLAGDERHIVAQVPTESA